MNLYNKLKEVSNSIKLIDTSEKVFYIIENEGVITGSSLWGVNDDNSDIDIILSPDCSIDWHEVMINHNGIYLHKADEGFQHYEEEDFKSCYVVYFEYYIYNLLFMKTNKAYQKWIYATNKINAYLKNDISFKHEIRGKEKRIEYFERFKEEYL